MDKEQMLKEARTNEAMRKGYMGLEGKFSIIAKQFGQPILQQGSKMHSQTFLDDPYETDSESLPTLDEEEESYEIGMQFDGLSRRLNMTIFVSHYLKEITVRYEGHIVYREIGGELEGFVGGGGENLFWEDKIFDLYSQAQKQENLQRPLERKRLALENKVKRDQVLDYLKSKWGL